MKKLHIPVFVALLMGSLAGTQATAATCGPALQHTFERLQDE